MDFIREAVALGLATAHISAFEIPKGCPLFESSFYVSVLDLYPKNIQLFRL
jgi:hypothetical protein